MSTFWQFHVFTALVFLEEGFCMTPETERV